MRRHVVWDDIRDALSLLAVDKLAVDEEASAEVGLALPARVAVGSEVVGEGRHRGHGGR